MKSGLAVVPPFGLAGGQPGSPGRNLLNGNEVPGHAALEVSAGDRLRLETPGGGGYGIDSAQRPDSGGRD